MVLGVVSGFLTSFGLFTGIVEPLAPPAMLMFLVAFLAITPVVVYIYLPFYRQLNVTSAYEYLEMRFNLAARWFGSASFLILQLGRTAIVLSGGNVDLATLAGFLARYGTGLLDDLATHVDGWYARALEGAHATT